MDAPLERPLGPLERWHWIANGVSPLNAIARVRVVGHLTEARVRAALDALQRRHPLLGVRVECDADGRRPRFVATSRTAPLRRVRAIGGDPDARWLADAEANELGRALGPDGPLLRAAWITTARPDGDVHDLLLTVAHTIADGTTVLALLRQWVVGLAASAPEGTGTARVLAAPEAMFPAPYRGARGLARMVAAQARDRACALLLRPRRLAASRAVPYHERRSRVVATSLDRAALANLVGRAREEKVTVHGVLSAAVARAVARERREGACHVAIGSPVDFRGELAPTVGGEDVGAFAATLPTYAPCDPASSLWSTARALVADLGARRRRGEHFSGINLLRWLAPASARESLPFVRLIERQGPGNVCVSNLGRVAFPERAGDLTFAAPQLIGDLSIWGYLVAAINTTHETLYWNFVHVDGIVPRARAEALAEASLRELRLAL